MVRCLRAEREQDVAELARRGARTRAGRGRSRGGGAGARPPRPSSAGRGRRRASSSPRSRTRPRSGSTRAPRRRRQRALPRERLAQLASRREPKQLARRSRLTMPNPPPCLSAKAAIARSASLSRSGRRSPARSASQSSSGPSGASRSARAAPGPFPGAGGGGRVHRRASASAAVPSREPSSATITSASGKCLAQRGDGPADPLLLVARRDEDGQLRRLSQPGIGGSTPSRAVFLTPYWPPSAPESSRASARRPASVSRSSTVESFCFANASTAVAFGLVTSTPTDGTPGAPSPA